MNEYSNKLTKQLMRNVMPIKSVEEAQKILLSNTEITTLDQKQEQVQAAKFILQSDQGGTKMLPGDLKAAEKEISQLIKLNNQKASPKREESIVKTQNKLIEYGKVVAGRIPSPTLATETAKKMGTMLTSADLLKAAGHDVGNNPKQYEQQIKQQESAKYREQGAANRQAFADGREKRAAAGIKPVNQIPSY